MVIITKNCNYYKTTITNIYQIITMCQALSKALYNDYLLLNFFVEEEREAQKGKKITRPWSDGASIQMHVGLHLNTL